MRESSMADMANFFESKSPSDSMMISNTPSTENGEKKKQDIEKFYAKLEEMGFNLEELKEILECNDTMLILSGAGAGKTTALIFKIIRDLIAGELIKSRVVNGSTIVTPANILVSTFLKSGAEELKQSFIDWCIKLNITGVDMSYIQFKTIHSEVYSTLKTMGVPIKIVENTDSMIRQVMQMYGVHSVMSNGKTITKDEVADIKGLISYVRNRLDNQRYNHPLMNEYTVDTLQMDLMLNTFKQLKMVNNVMDFEDMQEMLLEGMQTNPNVVDFIARRYDYVFVDEFQDTSQLQYELLKYYFNGAKKVVCLGDDDQCLVEGTKVNTERGLIPIEEVIKGDNVLSGIGNSKVAFHTVDHITKKKINEEIIVIKTKSGKEIKGTKDHIVFVKGYTGIDKRIKDKIEQDYKDIKGIVEVKTQGLFTDRAFGFIELKDILEGMVLPTILEDKVIEDEIISKSTEVYNGYVYDLSVPSTRNFSANGILVKNCIYSWRGSDIDIINTKFESDYNVEIKQLTTNYRCSHNILKAVIPSIEKNTNRSVKNLRAYRQGGEVNIVIDGSVNHLMGGINKDLLRGETVGVLARTNADLLIPAILLEISNEDVSFGLSKSVSLEMRIPKQVFGVIDLLTKRYTPEFETLLGLFVPRNKLYEVEKLCNVLKINKDKSLFTLPFEDIEYSAPTLLPMIRTLRNMYEISGKRAYVSMLGMMGSEVYNGKSIYAQNAREFVYYIKKIIQEHEMVKELSITELDNLFNRVLPTKLERRKNLKGRLFIKLSTVHEAKGKEWDNVYIWNDIDGCFPNSVGNRDLTKTEYEEERRVHYIAWTRPKKKLTVYTRSDRQGGFLSECDLSEAKFEEVKGLSSKLLGLKGNEESKVFTKKEEVLIENFDTIFNTYYSKFMSFTGMETQEWVNLDMCEARIGSKEKIIEVLKQKGIDKYPKDMINSAISDALSELAYI